MARQRVKLNVRQGTSAPGGHRGGVGKPGYPLPDMLKHRIGAESGLEGDGPGIEEVVEKIADSLVKKRESDLPKKKTDVDKKLKKKEPLDIVVRAVVADIVKKEDSQKKGDDLGFGFNEAGYPLQDKYEFQGMPISVENKKGSTRKWYDEDGKEKGSTKMRADYGYIDGAIGSDGEDVDVYVGTDESEFVYVVHQNKAPDFEKYDEDKVMLGFKSEEDAREAYLKQYDDPGFYGGMSSMPVEKFREKVKRADEPTKITNESKRVTHITDLTAEELDYLVRSLATHRCEISEKVDGAARIEFGTEYSCLNKRLWTRSKNSEKKYDEKEYGASHMFEMLREAHKKLELVKGWIPEDVTFVGDVLYGKRPNTIEYGRNAIVVHGAVGKTLYEENKLISFFTGVLPHYTGWSIDQKRTLKLSDFGIDERYPPPAEMFKKKLIEGVSKIGSAWGREVEGFVLRDIDTGKLTKVVNREEFTAKNRFFWRYRELLGRGSKIGEIWRKGVMAQTASLLKDALKSETPELVIAAEVPKIKSALRALRLEWRRDHLTESVGGKTIKLPDDIVAKTVKTFFEVRDAVDFIEALPNRLRAVGDIGTKKAIVKRILKNGAIVESLVAKLLTEAGQPGGKHVGHEVQGNRKPRLDAEEQKTIEGVITYNREVLQKHAYWPGSKLGMGANGIAFDLHGKVVKFTIDEDEAHSANVLVGKKLDRVAQIFDVFKLKQKGDKVVDIYGVVMEKVKILSAEEEHEFNHMMDLGEEMWGLGWEQWTRQELQHVTNKRKENMEAWKKLDAKWDPTGIIDELRKYNVDWFDMHGGNVGFRGDTVVAFDLGVSGSEHKVLRTLEAKAKGHVPYLTETRADTVGVTIGRFQPFHKGHAEVVRNLAKKFSRVIVVVAGNKRDQNNPFSLETRADMMKKSLPDVISKIEIVEAKFKGKQSGFLPGILSDIAKSGESTIKADTAVNILVGADRFEDVKKQFERAAGYKESGGEELTYDPELVSVDRMPDVTDEETKRISGTNVREMVKTGNEEAFKKIVDSHLSSNKEDLVSVWASLKKEMDVKEMKESVVVDEDLESAGGLDAVKNTVQNNSAALLKFKGLKLDLNATMGEPGKDGIAFNVGSGKVLKVTTDQPEAKAASSLKGKSLKHVVKIFDVFKFPDQSGKAKTPVFGILEEKLVSLTKSEMKDFMMNIAWLYDDKIFPSVKELILNWDWEGAKRAGRAKVQQLGKKVFEGSEDVTGKGFAPKHIEVDENQRILDQFDIAMKRLEDHFGITKMIADLRTAGIKFLDFHGGNVMKRGGDFVINDLGRSVSQGQEPPLLQKEASGFTGLGSTQASVKGGSSGFSSFHQKPDPDTEDLWQNQLKRLPTPRKGRPDTTEPQ